MAIAHIHMQMVETSRETTTMRSGKNHQTTAQAHEDLSMRSIVSPVVKERLGMNMNKLHSLLIDARGQALPEYALIIAVVSVALIVTIVAMRTQILGVFEYIEAAFGI